MDIFNVKSFLVLAVAGMSGLAHANGHNDYGFSTSYYNLSAQELVKKNQSIMTFTMTTTCHDSEASAIARADEVKETILAKLSKQAGDAWGTEVKLDENVKSKTTSNSSTRYYKVLPKESLVTVVKDYCGEETLPYSKYMEVKNNQAYQATASVSFIAVEDIGQLSELQQYAAKILADEEKLDESLTTNINGATPRVDPKTMKKVKKELAGELTSDSQTNISSMDEAFFNQYLEVEKSLEKYTTVDNENKWKALNFKTVRPQFDRTTGLTTLSTTYSFRVSYKPKNHGSLEENVEGVVEHKNYHLPVKIDVPFKKLRLSLALSSVCHSDKTSAETAVGEQVELTKKMVSEIAPEGNVFFRSISQASEQSHGAVYDVVEYKMGESGREYNRLVESKWIDLCSGKIVESKDSKYFALTQMADITVKTVAELEKLIQLFDEQNEVNAESSTAVKNNASTASIKAELSYEPHRDFVNGIMYFTALEMLSDPEGPVAKDLIDDAEVSASSAYYQFLGTNQITRARGMRGGAMPEMAMSVAGDEAYLPPVSVDDSNIEDAKVELERVVKVTWRPKADLLTVINKRRIMEEEFQLLD